MNEKFCRGCGRNLPATEFYVQEERLYYRCKDCVRVTNHRNYLKNKSRHLAVVAAWRRDNPEKVKAYRNRTQTRKTLAKHNSNRTK